MSRQKDERGKLFIGRLSWETQSDTLLNYFSRYGEVIDCVVMKNKETGCSRGFGFVTYKDPECVNIILSGGPHIIDGRQVDPKACNPRTPHKVAETRPQQAPSESQTKKIFVGGLPFDVDEGILIEYFSRYGKVKEASIMYDLQKGRSRGFGFLTFSDEDSVDEVCKEHFVTINGKQVECKRAEPLSRNKMTQNNDDSGNNNENYFMPPAPPHMLHQLQHPPPFLDHKPSPPLPGVEMWRPPPEGSNTETRNAVTPENGYSSVPNGDSLRQPDAANGATTSIYQPVSYPGIYSVAQQQQMRQQPQPAIQVQQHPTPAGQAYPPPRYPNFSSPPPSAQQSSHDYVAPWNQPAPTESPVQTVPVDKGQWTGVPPLSLLPTQQPQQQQQQQQQQQPPPQQQPNSSYNIPSQLTSPSALPTVYPGLSPLGHLKIPPNFVNAPPQTPVQQSTSSGMPYSNYGFADAENPNLPLGPGTHNPAGNGHMMMLTPHIDAANLGHSYNQRQPITQTYHPYRR